MVDPPPHSQSIQLHEAEDTDVIFGRGGHLHRRRRNQEFRHVLHERKAEYRNAAFPERNQIVADIIETATAAKTRFFQHKPKQNVAEPIKVERVREKIRQMYNDIFKRDAYLQLEQQQRQQQQNTVMGGVAGSRILPNPPLEVPKRPMEPSPAANHSKRQRTDDRPTVSDNDAPSSVPTMFQSCVLFVNDALTRIAEQQLAGAVAARQQLEQCVKGHNEIKAVKEHLVELSLNSGRCHGIPPDQLLTFVVQNVAGAARVGSVLVSEAIYQHQPTVKLDTATGHVDDNGAAVDLRAATVTQGFDSANGTPNTSARIVEPWHDETPPAVSCLVGEIGRSNHFQRGQPADSLIQHHGTPPLRSTPRDQGSVAEGTPIVSPPDHCAPKSKVSENIMHQVNFPSMVVPQTNEDNSNEQHTPMQRVGRIQRHEQYPNEQPTTRYSIGERALLLRGSMDNSTECAPAKSPSPDSSARYDSRTHFTSSVHRFQGRNEAEDLEDRQPDDDSSINLERLLARATQALDTTEYDRISSTLLDDLLAKATKAVLG